MERHFRSVFPQVSPDETALIRFPFERLLKKVGFTDIKIVPFDWLHPSMPPSLINTVTKISNTLENIPIIREFAGSLFIQCRRP